MINANRGRFNMDRTKHALNYFEKLTSNRVSMSFDLNSQKMKRVTLNVALNALNTLLNIFLKLQLFTKHDKWF